MGRLGVILLSLLLSTLAFAGEFDEMLDQNEFSGFMPTEETIIDESFISKNQWQEPMFGEPERKAPGRRISSRSRDDDEGLGEIEVTSEIPFTYPWMTHRALQQEVLKRLQQREAKKPAKAKNS